MFSNNCSLNFKNQLLIGNSTTHKSNQNLFFKSWLKIETTLLTVTKKIKYVFKPSNPNTTSDQLIRTFSAMTILKKNVNSLR